MSPEEGKALVRRAVDEVFNHGDLSVATEVYGPGYAEHEAQFTRLVRAAFPDLRVRVEQQVCDGELVATRWRATGTHRGTFLGVPPTGRGAEWTGIWMQRLAGGRIVEGQDWSVWDAAGLLRQLTAADGGSSLRPGGGAS